MVVAVVVAVITSVPAPEAIEEEASPHVTGLVALVGLAVTAQLMATAPVNPPSGVTVTVDVLPVVAPGIRVMLAGLAVNAKLDEPAAEPLTTVETPAVCT